MSRGSRRRRSFQKTHTASPGDQRQIWVIAPSRESDDQIRLREEARRRAEGQGLVVVVRRTKLCIVEGGPESHKRFEVLDPRDAGDLYAAANRMALLVLSLTACYVRLDPSETPSRRRRLRSLENFVQYKAFYGLARSLGDPARLVDEFAGWPHDGTCTGTDDPRVLPLHVFDNERLWDSLRSEDARTRFDSEYGTATRRVDCAGRSWSPAHVGHGTDILTVSGYQLKAGFHWDVTRGRLGGRRLVTSHEVWLLRHPTSYANVYPDAYVRGAPRGNVQLVWPR